MWNLKECNKVLNITKTKQMQIHRTNQQLPLQGGKGGGAIQGWRNKRYKLLGLK